MRVAHEEERRETVEQVAEPGERDLDALLRPTADGAVRQRAPEQRRLQLLLGEVDLSPADVLVRVHRELLVDGGERRDEDLAMSEVEAARLVRALARLQGLELVDDADAHRETRVG